MFVTRCLFQLIILHIAVCVVIPSNRILQQLQQLFEPTVRNSTFTTTIDSSIPTLHYVANNDDNPSGSVDAFILAMFPSEKGSFPFNDANQEEWKISHSSDVEFVVYGKNLDGANLSFTSNPDSCDIERKNHLYRLTVDTVDSKKGMIERAFVTINLPYYHTKLYVCLEPPNATDSFHQGDRPSLKLILTRRTVPIWATIILVLCLLCLSGLFSGLNLGLMSLTPHDLTVIQEAGTPHDRVYAKRIYPIRKRGNFLLCTILLGNVLVNSTTTILLDTLISGILAVAGATLAIVIFGEIIPQAICSRHGLKVGAKTVVFTYVFMALTSPISFPLSKLLDYVLGDEVGSTYTRDQMRILLKHTQTTDVEEREKNIMTGVLSLKTKKIRDIMTNLIDVFMLEASRVVDDELVLNIHSCGYSRIPVYEKQRENIIGLVNIRDFALLDTDSGKFTVRSLMNFFKHRYGKAVMPDDSCYDVFNKLKKEQYHMGIVVEYSNTGQTDPKARAIGIVTLEDIIEEMIQEEIIDETDVFTDNRGKVRNMLSQAPDFSAFFHQTETYNDTAKISAQMKVAILQFLSTTVEPFSSRFISSDILARLLNVQFYHEFEYDEEKAKEGIATHIYEYGRPADYFVLILNGEAELVTGKEKIVSEVGPFSYFGVSALCSPHHKVEDVLLSKYLKVRPFVPDFSLRVRSDVQILRIRRKHWLAAIRATFFQNKQEENGGPSIFNPDGEPIDLLTQELQKANCADRSEICFSPASETNDEKYDRATSLTASIKSDRGTVKHRDAFKRLRSRSSPRNTDKIRPESPTILNLDSPNLTPKQTHDLSPNDHT